MRTQNKNPPSDSKSIYYIVIGLLFVGVFILGTFDTLKMDRLKHDMSFECAINHSLGYAQGINDTLNNNTLMIEVANNVNLYQIRQYGSPIVYVNGRYYAFRNATEVSLK